MKVAITNRILPGIGACNEMDVGEGHRIGVVSRRNGMRDLVIYDEEGDGAAVDIQLTPDEADALAQLLGAPPMLVKLAEIHEQAESLVVEQLPVSADSPFAGRSLGDTHTRTRTGASIVAVLRKDSFIPSPTPDFRLNVGDLLVTVGTHSALQQVSALLSGYAGDKGS